MNKDLNAVKRGVILHLRCAIGSHSKYLAQLAGKALYAYVAFDSRINHITSVYVSLQIE